MSETLFFKQIQVFAIHVLLQNEGDKQHDSQANLCFAIDHRVKDSVYFMQMPLSFISTACIIFKEYNLLENICIF